MYCDYCYNYHNITLFIAGTEVVLSTSSLVFQMTNERCVTVSVPESNRRGSRSYQLVIDPPSPGSSSVPVLVYPSTIPIIVIDNDGSGNYTLPIIILSKRFLTCSM